jgi:hypothetical protein
LADQGVAVAVTLQLLPAGNATVATKDWPDSENFAASGPESPSTPCQSAGCTLNIPTVVPAATGAGALKELPLPVTGGAGVKITAVDGPDETVRVNDSVAMSLLRD